MGGFTYRYRVHAYGYQSTEWEQVSVDPKGNEELMVKILLKNIYLQLWIIIELVSLLFTECETQKILWRRGWRGLYDIISY